MTTALYIHIPGCARKCPYCSFPVVAGKSFHEEIYLDAVAREASLRGGREVSSLYVGGGTPSLLSEEGIARLGMIIREYFSVGNVERVFEMNPESVTPAKAALLKSLGFNRVSFGAQSFDRRYLSYLGRTHGVQESFRAFKVLRSAGFDNISVDLMFGFPGQTGIELEEDLDALLSLGSEHAAVYALTVDERSVFYVRGERVSVDDQGEFYHRVCQRLNAAGLMQYEVSNFARLGFASRHNMHYWEGGDYVGLGMGAHSHLDGERFWNTDILPRYLELIRSGGNAEAGRERLTPQARLMESFVFGLRMNAGVDPRELEARFGVPLPDDQRDEVKALIAEGFLAMDNTRIRTTDQGRLVLDAISSRLI